VIDFTAETQRRSVNKTMALLARVLADLLRLDVGVAAMAQRTIVVPDEARIGQLLGAQLTAEALGMPRSLHSFDDTPNNDLVALVAVRRKERAEILLAVFAAFELVKDSILERPEALRTAKNGMVKLLLQLLVNALTQSTECATIVHWS